MSDNKPVHPVAHPEQAAQEVILELIRSGAVQHFLNTRMETNPEQCSKYLISIHKELTDYYKTLDK